MGFVTLYVSTEVLYDSVGSCGASVESCGVSVVILYASVGSCGASVESCGASVVPSVVSKATERS